MPEDRDPVEDDPFPVPAIASVPEPADAPVVGDKPERTPAQVAQWEQVRSARSRGAKGKGKVKIPSAPRAAQAAGTDTVRLERAARESLIRWRAEIGAGMLMITPVPATYIARTPDEVIEAAVRLAARNAKVLAALAGGADLLAGIVLIRWSIGLGAAIAVQTGNIAPDSPAAGAFGITEIVNDLVREGFVDTAPIPIETRPEVASDDDASTSHRPAPAAVAIV